AASRLGACHFTRGGTASQVIAHSARTTPSATVAPLIHLPIRIAPDLPRRGRRRFAEYGGIVGEVEVRGVAGAGLRQGDGRLAKACMSSVTQSGQMADTRRRSTDRT